jgi:hypothetical protein
MRDVRVAARRGKDMAKLKTVLGLLVEQAPLPESYRVGGTRVCRRPRRHSGSASGDLRSARPCAPPEQSAPQNLR